MFERTYVEEAKDRLGESITLAGWVTRTRVLRNISFIILRDKSGEIQVTVKDDDNQALVSELGREDVIKVTGKAVESSIVHAGVEFIPDSIEVVNKAKQPLPFDLFGTVKAELDTRLNYRFMDFRTEHTSSIFKIQNVLLTAFRGFLTDRGYMEFQPPCIIATASEGGADLFKTGFESTTSPLIVKKYVREEVKAGAEIDVLSWDIVGPPGNTTLTYVNIGYDGTDALDVDWATLYVDGKLWMTLYGPVGSLSGEYVIPGGKKVTITLKYVIADSFTQGNRVEGKRNSYTLTRPAPTTSPLIVKVYVPEEVKAGAEIDVLSWDIVGPPGNTTLTYVNIGYNGTKTTDVDWANLYVDGSLVQTLYGPVGFMILNEFIPGGKKVTITLKYIIHDPFTQGNRVEGKINSYTLTRPAYLAQSPQLYKQMCAISFEKVYTVTPIWRAEKFNTPTHLNEVRQMDIEQAFADDETVMKVLEEILAHMLTTVKEKCPDELEVLGRELVVPELPFRRVTYTEAIEMLQDAGEEIAWGDDFSKPQERKLTELVGKEAFFLKDWPSVQKAFYAMPYEDNPDIVHAFDCIYSGIEISSGTMRIHMPELLKEQLRKKGLNPDNFTHYIESFAYGAPPHAGWSIGLERLTMTVTGMTNIRECTMFPRDRDRLVP